MFCVFKQDGVRTDNMFQVFEQHVLDFQSEDHAPYFLLLFTFYHIYMIIIYIIIYIYVYIHFYLPFIYIKKIALVKTVKTNAPPLFPGCEKQSFEADSFFPPHNSFLTVAPLNFFSSYFTEY